eukprot:TRINITY_DN1671_c0_g1_i1.p5 TRINITY_DN1671_c0_g1~~TRINITY_DN1671_c0_g1_i1.p5  ORF type:complete len:118 (-),score=5.45 TRINITY_DN1671_c0_g1_i1:149-502(-)
MSGQTFLEQQWQEVLTPYLQQHCMSPEQTVCKSGQVSLEQHQQWVLTPALQQQAELSPQTVWPSMHVCASSGSEMVSVGASDRVLDMKVISAVTIAVKHIRSKNPFFMNRRLRKRFL